MLTCNNDILINFEKAQFNVYNLKSNTSEHIKIDKLNDDEKLGYIMAGTVSVCGTYICVSDDFKRLMLYKKIASDWVLIRKCILDRRCSNIKFSHDMNDILIADKSGYILKFPLDFDELELNNEDNRLNNVVMGHVSVLVDFDLHPKQKLIATADRDEKIRVSHYPNCHEIYTFLLGHTKYVTQVAFSKDGKTLYSAAADGDLISWDLCARKEIFRHTYFKSDDGSDIPVVTRMLIDDDKIFLFFKNESYAQIIYVTNTDSTAVNIDLGVSVIDVACSKIEAAPLCYYVLSCNDSKYKLSEFIFDESSKNLMSRDSWLDNAVLAPQGSVFERSTFLDTLSKTAQDKTGMEVYYENKIKRMRLNESNITNEDNEDDD